MTMYQAGDFDLENEPETEPRPRAPAKPDKADGLDWRSVLRPVRASDLDGAPVPPREWVIDEWLPERVPALFTGPAGVGKTLLAMQMAVALALGIDWLGLRTRRKRVLMVLCEDDGDETHRRLADIANGYGVRLSDLDGLLYLDRVGQDNTLIGRTKSGLIGTTGFHGLLGEMIADEKIEVLIGDNARHLFDVEEQKGPDVTKAVGLYHGLMVPTGGTSVLLHHPNKAGTSEFSGSVAWEAAVRARFFMARANPPESEPTDDFDFNHVPISPNDMRRLSKSKANMSSLSGLDLRYDRGFFRLVEGAPDPRTADPLTVKAYRAKVRDGFLAALDQLAAQGRNLSHSRQAKNYAPREIKRICPKFDQRDLEFAMNELLDTGVIAANQIIKVGNNRHPIRGLGRVGVGDPSEGEGEGAAKNEGS